MKKILPNIILLIFINSYSQMKKIDGWTIYELREFKEYFIKADQEFKKYFDYSYLSNNQIIGILVSDMYPDANIRIAIKYKKTMKQKNILELSFKEIQTIKSEIKNQLKTTCTSKKLVCSKWSYKKEKYGKTVTLNTSYDYKIADEKQIFSFLSKAGFFGDRIIKISFNCLEKNKSDVEKIVNKLVESIDAFGLSLTPTDIYSLFSVIHRNDYWK